MDQEHVKEVLLMMFKIDFNIEKYFEQNGESTQSFEHQVGFEFATSESEWHEAWMDVAGTIYVKKGYDDFHNPLNDGHPGENQGEADSIDDWSIDCIHIFLDGEDVSGTVSIDDLNKKLDEPIKSQS